MPFKRTSFKSHSIPYHVKVWHRSKKPTVQAERVYSGKEKIIIKFSITAKYQIPTNEWIKLKKLYKSLHRGDATSMSKVRESVEENQILVININYKSSSTMFSCTCIFGRTNFEHMGFWLVLPSSKGCLVLVLIFKWG